MIKSLIKKIISERSRINIRFFFYKIRAIFLLGNTYYCICCDKSFRKFLTFGNIPRENASCPNCGSLERTRLVHLYLLNDTNIFEVGKKILHFAPERKLETKFKNISNEYVSADINPALADVVIDITQIPYSDNTFDYVICSHVLGHVPDEPKAIDEIYRVLKPGGRAIILTLINRELKITFEDSTIKSAQQRLQHYGEFDLVRLHGLDFDERLKRPNIKVQKIDYRLAFSALEQEKFRLGNGDRELIFDCEKLI